MPHESRVKQPTHCNVCGIKLEKGECGKGWCSKCETYTMRIVIGWKEPISVGRK